MTQIVINVPTERWPGILAEVVQIGKLLDRLNRDDLPDEGSQRQLCVVGNSPPPRPGRHIRWPGAFCGSGRMRATAVYGQALPCRASAAARSWKDKVAGAAAMPPSMAGAWEVIVRTSPGAVDGQHHGSGVVSGGDYEPMPEATGDVEDDAVRGGRGGQTGEPRRPAARRDCDDARAGSGLKGQDHAARE